MNKNSIWKWLILVFLVASSLAVVWPPKEKITLGLDLQGGSSFVLEVNTDDLDEKAKEDAPERALEVIRNRIDELGGTEPIIYLEPHTKRIVVQIPGMAPEDRERARNSLLQPAFLEFKLVHKDNDSLADAVLNGQPPPGYKAVTVTGRQQRYLQRDPAAEPAGATRESIAKSLRTYKAPPNHDLMLMKEVIGGQEVFEPVYVKRLREKFTGENLVDAGVRQDQGALTQTYVVTLEFDAKGRKQFTQTTKDYSPMGDRNPSEVGRRLGIVLDGTLFSAPTLKVPIFSGTAQIEGNFNYVEARDLALVLRAGALPGKVEIIQERQVAPTLGHDSVTSGVRAVIYGAVAVLIFMLAYYLLAGVIANLALALDMILLPLGMMVAAGFLSLFTGGGAWSGQISLPTLTLAGIAGIVLTIGMAVDANVLIFERIREEQKAGKRFKSAVDAGYSKVFSTIFDANITTLLTAVILFWQGSGPIRGFAITLSAGIIVSMYVALVVTRMFFNILANSTSIDHVKMLSLVKNTKIDFLGKRFVAACLSLVIIGGSWIVFFNKGTTNFGVDFTGGSAITFEADPETAPSTEELRAFLDESGVTGAGIQFQKELAGSAGESPSEFFVIQVDYESGEEVAELVGAEYKDAGLTLVQRDSVGPQVGKELRKKGIMAIVWALVGIVIYISLRFEFGFAIGAIVALAHDVLVTVGVYCLLGRQLNLTIVAALLTIVGYSVNDTIVVFDRIREDKGLYRDKKYKEIANLSINQTLGRTLLTSITTLLTVVMLLVFGGGSINDFALALFIGILVGTYSSIFVATPVTLLWHRDERPTFEVETATGKKQPGARKPNARKADGKKPNGKKAAKKKGA